MNLGHAEEGTAAFLAIHPVLLRHARFAFRAVRDPAGFDDRVQETLALCWLWCRRLCARGRDPRAFPTVLAAYAVRQVRSGRSFVGRKTYRNDALSPHAQAVRGFLTQALPDFEARAGSRWQAMLQDNTISPVPVQAAFRIDFPAWLGSLPGRKRSVAEDLASGESTQDVAARQSLSPGRVSQLRRELHAAWLAFTGPRRPTATAPPSGDPVGCEPS